MEIIARRVFRVLIVIPLGGGFWFVNKVKSYLNKGSKTTGLQYIFNHFAKCYKESNLRNIKLCRRRMKTYRKISK